VAINNESFGGNVCRLEIYLAWDTPLRLNRGLAGLGLLLVFVAAFLPWLYGPSAFFGTQKISLFEMYLFALNDIVGSAFIYAVSQDSLATLTLVLYPIVFLWGVYVVYSRGYSIVWPGVLAIITSLIWLYDVSTQGANTQFANVSGPYIAAFGGVLMLFSMIRTGGKGRGGWR
jgi:hypothetical protein